MEKFVVQTNYGPIRGCHKTSQLNDDYFAYQGIPFAKPPIGELRFKAPEPCEPWKDILDATKEKPIPFPADRSTVMHDNSEDCLYLNIYKKDVSPKFKKTISLNIKNTLLFPLDRFKRQISCSCFYLWWCFSFRI